MTAFEHDAPASSPEDLSQLAIQLYYQSDEARTADRVLIGRKAALAERPLRWIAIIHTIGTFVIFGILHRRWAEGDMVAERLVVIHGVVSIAYWAIWWWSFTSPLPAAIVGLLLLLSMSMATLAASGTVGHEQTGAPLGGSLPLITTALLVRAIFNGWRERVLQLNHSLDPTAKPRALGIASPILLYLMLLSIVVIPICLAADHDLEIKDLLDVQKFMAIVITTWAIIAWRDTLPAVRSIGSINWLVSGVVLGCGTAIFASIYLSFLQYFTGIEPMAGSQKFLQANYSWTAILFIVAVCPAIFEELAFRGVIVPGLMRVLSEKEGIAVSAFMFMILHLSVPSAPHLLLVGVLAGFLRVRSKSIWPCVLLHFTHNAMCLAFERWM